ncbi:type II restriction endonuclease subunit R [Paraeggerthella hongkongensis]|uniref:Type II restriction endonuclease subunit R n=2 Tax=Paraeggerthella hongkongensis TaxID=230658 RepID=A0A3N0BEA4_9ACTN|nr:type II restriction endonuclease subunit R [Paraeggerthella hongkongensis]
MGDDEITVEKITGMNSGVIKPRIAKEQEKQSQRTKSRAEVFTPSWLCNQMNNDLDEAWFGRRDVFNTEIVADDGANTWTPTSDPIEFLKSKGHGWRAYVEAPRLEITCGEAPFVCSRYDTVTGDELPVSERVGFLDRKLRVVTEKTKTRKEWVRRALDALRATYGFEYQGDNLLIARINVLETFAEHLRNRWGSDPQQDELEQAAWIVSWNFWQMNGFTDAVPTNKMGAEVESTLGTFEEPEPEPIQPSLFDLFDDVFLDETTEETEEEEPKETVPLCVIYDWQNGEPFEFATLKGKAAAMGKKFYAVIGNPPYQETVEGTSDKPIYNYFIDEAYKVSKRTELITPARFLFNAGKTPKDWNRKMLDDPHLKVVNYQQKSDTVFPNTDIKGGVAVTYWEGGKVLGPIGVFSPYNELRSIQMKVSPWLAKQGLLSDVMYLQNRFNLAALYEDYPEARDSISSNGKERRIVTSSFNKLNCFSDEKQSDDSIQIVGLLTGNKRRYRWIQRKYVEDNGNLTKFKVILPMANGSGAIGEVLSTPLIGEPLIGYTQSFMGIGACDEIDDAKAIMKYIKTKFARTLLGILKITQHNTPEKWAYVPLQDFTSDSDIDWSQPVADVDKQLYAKYGLDDKEIEFIESHVKEMD